jgi:hypothetical protein
MQKQNSVQEFLDLLSQFSTVKKIHNGKRLAYAIPNLLDDEIPDLEIIKKVANTHKIKIQNDEDYQIILIF